jgi:hypothetical protein
VEKLPFKIRTYSSRHTYPSHTVFLLNKGNNSGKPGRLPWVNSFAIVCDSEEMADRIYSSAFIIFTARAYEPVLNGSVFNFLRKYDLIKVLADHSHLFSDEGKQQEQKKLLGMLAHVEQMEQQRIKMKKLVRAYARSLLN